MSHEINEPEIVFPLSIDPMTLGEAQQLATQRGTTVNELIVIAVEHELITATQEMLWTK